MQRKGFNTVLFLALMPIIACLFPAEANADIPDFIGYQGFLTDEEGDPVSGYVNIQFTIYDSEEEGTSLWEEGQSVLATDGLISTTLGISTPLTPDVFTSGTAYLEVEIDGDVMLPRLPMGSVPYCFYADNAPTSAEVLNWVIEGGYLTSSESDSRYYEQSEIDTLLGVKQNMVTGTCGDGNSIREINLDGSVVCEPDDNTEYTAGAGLALAGTEFGLEASYLDGSVHDPRFVNVEGDTMTGALNLPSDGLVVGTDQLVCSGGNVGIGTTSPGAKLNVNGDINIAGNLLNDGGDMESYHKWVEFYHHKDLDHNVTTDVFRVFTGTHFLTTMEVWYSVLGSGGGPTAASYNGKLYITCAEDSLNNQTSDLQHNTQSSADDGTYNFIITPSLTMSGNDIKVRFLQTNDHSSNWVRVYVHVKLIQSSGAKSNQTQYDNVTKY